uniref:Uncharacterized protein n=1 Tax=Arundo donax TaxID=35708 RepID=A0A0A9F8K0_ARUDO
MNLSHETSRTAMFYQVTESHGDLEIGRATVQIKASLPLYGNDSRSLPSHRLSLFHIWKARSTVHSMLRSIATAAAVTAAL